MSKDNQHQKRPYDPLIYGPASPKAEISPESTPRPSASEVRYDLYQSNPLRDFKTLFLSPKKFFRSFASVTSTTPWLWVKALLGIFVLQAVVHLMTGKETLESELESLRELKRMQKEFGGGLFKLPDLEEQLKSSIPFMHQFRPFLLPASMLLGSAFKALSAFWFLPVVGVPRAKYSYPKLFLIFCFSQWWQVLEALPFVPSFAASLVVWWMGILALREIYDLSFFRSVVASDLLSWIVALTFFASVMGLLFGVFAG